jgi:hypothetical protein
MGQVALGLRSLLIKAIVFFVMAALLAWALGGTLWPRAEIVELEGVAWGTRLWFWQASVGGRAPGEVRWQLMVATQGEPARPVDERRWATVSGPVAAADALYYAGQPAPGDGWRIERIAASGPPAIHEMPDRLAVEQQLARVGRGLAIQDVATILRQRSLVLDPPGPKADE